VDEVVRNYIDAIHFDDYFYPYKIAGKTLMILLHSKKYGGGMSL
jgi:uncharacterized lipoprotein YddW (UPF0748 family)